jgi:hypothetical protein
VNWNAIGAFAEILGAAGVIVSLLYLGAQIRSNTRAMKAGAGFDATHSWASTNEMAAANWSDELFESVIRSFDPSASHTDFSDLETGRIGIAFRALFQKLEGQYFLRKHGYLESELWEKRRVWARGLIDLPFYRRWWELEKEQRIYTDGFIAAIEAAESIEVVVAGLRRGS